MTPGRPVLRYHGGKWRIAKWVIGHFPAHRIYVEPFGGAASVLLRKTRSFAEVYNDLDGDVVNVFRVLRDPELALELQRLVSLTPWARQEFELSYEPTDDPVERARRTIVRCFMAHGSTSRRIGRTGFRAKNYRRNQTGAADWRNWPEQVPAFVERLRGVTIEHRNALEVIRQQDTPETLFYVDPPYALKDRRAVRGRGDFCRAYVHEMEDEDHRELAEVLHSVEGMVVLSGYAGALFSELYEGWHTAERATQTDGGGVATEVLWLSPRAAARRVAQLAF